MLRGPAFKSLLSLNNSPQNQTRPAHHAGVAGDVALGRGAGAVGVAGALHTAAWLAVCGRGRADTRGGGGADARCAGGASSSCLALVLVAHGAGAALGVVQALLQPTEPCISQAPESGPAWNKQCLCFYDFIENSLEQNGSNNLPKYTLAFLRSHAVPGTLPVRASPGHMFSYRPSGVLWRISGWPACSAVVLCVSWNSFNHCQMQPRPICSE
jgi:hypothetical protein